MSGLTVAVVGATGVVGREFLRIAEERDFPIRELRLLASRRSAGKRLTFRGQEVEVQETTPQAFKGVDIAFVSVSSSVSRQVAPWALSAGAVMIDDSSAFRMHPEVPLVVPEVNGEDVEWHKGLLAIPNCSTTPLVMVLRPLDISAGVRRVIADTYQSASGYGGSAVVELEEQSWAVLEGRQVWPSVLPKRIAFNLFPHIDDFLESGYTKEEQKMTDETRKIMHRPDIAVSATCVRVPVKVSHSEAVHVELGREMSAEEAREILASAPGVKVLDDPSRGLYPTPWEVAGTDEVFVGRIRRDQSHPRGLAMWIVCDNLRKGAALNAIQIAEEMLRRECLKPRNGWLSL